LNYSAQRSEHFSAREKLVQTYSDFQSPKTPIVFERAALRTALSLKFILRISNARNHGLNKRWNSLDKVQLSHTLPKKF